MVRCGDIGISEYRDHMSIWCGLKKNILSFAVQIGRHQADTRNIAHGASERRRKPGGDHILGHDNQWNGLRRFLKPLRNKISRDHNRVRCGLDNGRHHSGGLLIVESEAVRDEFEVLSFDETESTQFIKKGQSGWLVSSR